METIDCPLCSKPFSIEEIQNHAENCNGEEDKDIEMVDSVDLSSEKLPSETYSQYYARKGCKKIIPQTLKVPDHLQENPFILYCPYDVSCGWMEACNFPQHASTNHTTNSQKVSCPICDIMGESNGPENNLLQHLQEAHPEMKPEEAGLPNAYAPVGDIFTEYTLDTDMKEDLECVTCFEPFLRGQVVIRTDCYCLYHKSCSQSWFEKEKKCPVHGSGLDIPTDH